jgi:hypothetical protein
MNTVRRVSYVFLCIVPFLSFVVVGVRAFRVPGVYQAVGVAYFATIAIAAWTLGRGRQPPHSVRKLRLPFHDEAHRGLAAGGSKQ